MKMIHIHSWNLSLDRFHKQGKQGKRKLTWMASKVKIFWACILGELG